MKRLFSHEPTAHQSTPSHGRCVLALVLALLVVGCRTGTSREAAIVKENETTARLLMQDFQTGDVSDLARLFVPTAVYDDYSAQREYQGLEEITGYVKSLQQWADDITLSVNKVHSSTTSAVVEWTLSATQDRPIPGVAPTATGNDVVVNGTTILEISNHFITRAADYMDDLGMMLQLGGELHMPGGLILKNNQSSGPSSTGPEGAGVGR